MTRPNRLAGQLSLLGQRTTAALTKAHDFHHFSILSWRAVKAFCDAGQSLEFSNPTTGTTADASQIVAISRDFAGAELAGVAVQKFVSIFEEFLFDFLRLWLAAFPQSLAGKTVKFRVVLDALGLADVADHVIGHVVGHELNELRYKKTAEWFAYLDGLVKFGVPSSEEVGRLAEAKATRDLLAHGQVLVNATYVAKCGDFRRLDEGAPVAVTVEYLQETWLLLGKLVGDLTDAALAKLAP